ncbi:MAG: XRE family transcriptional regulator [Chthoniobacterales bacterium]
MIPAATTLFGTRLLQARKRHAWSLRDLAEKLGGQVSAAALNKYEKGAMHPSPSIVIALCEILGLSEDFFVRPLTSRLGRVDFRKRSSLGVKEEESIREITSDFFERYTELEELVGLTDVFINPLAGHRVEKAEDVEAAADQLRKLWKMGTAPIPSVVGLLEAKHILVHLLEAPSGFDGFSGKAGPRDVVALNSRYTVDRRRFSALHELGHIVLQFAADAFDEKAREKLCHRFAGAMLLPRETFLAEIGSRRQHISLAELKNLKSIHGISCAAILSRAGTLGVLAESTLTRIWARWSAQGYRTQDPGECPFDETPRRFDLLLQRGVAEKCLSLDKAAMLAGKSEEEFSSEWEIYP